MKIIDDHMVILQSKEFFIYIVKYHAIIHSKSEKEPICERQEFAAVVNFNFGVSCGKRDSRLADLIKALTILTFCKGVPSSWPLKRRMRRR